MKEVYVVGEDPVTKEIVSRIIRDYAPNLYIKGYLPARGGEIKLKMWLYPWLTWLVIAFIIFVLVVMLFRPAQQLEVISTGLLAIGIICTVPIMSRWKKLLSWQKAPLQNTH